MIFWNVLCGMVDGDHVLEQLAVSILRQNLEAAGSFKTQVYNYQTTFRNTAIIIYAVLPASFLIIIASISVTYIVYF